MASSQPKQWDVDKESKAKLQALQALTPNKACADCSSPSPQWASPKFGTLICLTCAGLHRGLGVHISFVRSIAMDAFKPAEVARMEKGGNARWHKFYEQYVDGTQQKKQWDWPGKGGDQAAKKRLEAIYGGPVGTEYKERLSCDVEGREFTGVPEQESRKSTPQQQQPPAGNMGSGTGRSQKEMNEDFFARKGNENASRPSGLKPSEGGKFEGFGSSPAPAPGAGGQGQSNMPGVDDFQKDPVAALSKGLGWFTGQVGKGAKSVNEGWIQPTAQKIAEADLANQARQTAASASKALQTGTRGAAERFNNFIENEGGPGGSSSINNSKPPERQDFWDSFGQPADGEERSAGGAGAGAGSIGTAAMRKGGEAGGGSGGGADEGWSKQW